MIATDFGSNSVRRLSVSMIDILGESSEERLAFFG